MITSVEAKNGNDWYTVFDPNIDNKRYGNDGMIEHGTRDDGIVKAVDSVFTSEGKQYWIFEKIGDNIELGDNFVTNKEDTVNINYNRLNNINEYVVQRGDTLIDIAKKFDTTVESLVKINNIRNANLISIGQVIEIPSVQTSKTKSSKTFVKAETIEAEKVSRNMEHSKSVASEIVSTFEGGKNALAGNFDGAGLSIGYIQMNLKYSLHLVLDAYANELDTKKEFESFFEFDTTFEKNGELIKMKGYEVIREVIKLPKEDRIKWGDSISDINSKTPKYGLKEPWRTAFKNMLKSDKFQHVYESSPHVQSYYSKANDIMNYIGMKTVRGYTLALDISVNNGSTPTKVVDEAMNSVPNRLTSLNDVYFDEIKNADKKKADIRVVKDLMNCLEGITDPMLKKAYYASAAAALQKSDGYSWDSWIRKKAIIQGKGEVHGIPINAKRLTDDSIISN